MCINVIGQNENRSEKESLLSIKTSYGYFVPGGDLKDRFGNSIRFTGGLDYVSKNGFGLVFESGFGFGSKINEDVLSSIRSNTGAIVGIDGISANVFARMRVLNIGGLAYKIFDAKGNKNGLKLGIGVGILAHYLKFVDENSSVAQLYGDYKKGYDRLTRGAYLQEELGWAIHSKSGLLNGSIVLELNQGFTKSVRINQISIPSDSGKKMDLYSGLKVNWKIPIKRFQSGTLIYY